MPGVSGRSEEEEERSKERSRQRVQSEADRAESLRDTSLSVRLAALAPTMKWDLLRIREVMSTVGCFGLFQRLPKGHQSSSRAIQIYLDDDEKYYRLFQLGHGQRLNFIPKRHIGWATFAAVRNCVSSLRCAANCLCAFPMHHMQLRGPLGVVPGAAVGMMYAALYLFLGYAVSPLWHVSHGTVNQGYAMYNSLTSHYTYDASRGRYIRSDLALTEQMKNEILKDVERVITVGSKEYELKKRSAESSVSGKSFMQQVEELVAQKQKERAKKKKGTSGKSSPYDQHDEEGVEQVDHYEALQIKKSATPAEVKSSYQRLAKAYHPDHNPQDPHAADRFQRIATAYRTLSDPKLRRTYDMGGARAQQMASRGQGFETLLTGSPQEVLQKVFGGTPFKQFFVGDFYRSTIHLRTCNSCIVSSAEFEILQTYRAQLLSLELRKILDVNVYPSSRRTTTGGAGQKKPQATSVHPLQRQQQQRKASGSSTLFSSKKKGVGKGSSLGSQSSKVDEDRNRSRSTTTTAAAGDNDADDDGGDPNYIPGEEHVSEEFKYRCEVLVKRLELCSFGRELMYDLGRIYEMNARRYLKEVPFFYPRLFQQYAVFGGYKTLYRMYLASRNKDVGKQHMIAFLDMEYDNIWVDISVAARYAAMFTVNDVSIRKMKVPRHPLPPPSTGSAGKRKPKGSSGGNAVDGDEGMEKDDGENFLTPREIRERRLLALLYLGRLMQKRGLLFGSRTEDEAFHQLRVVAQSEANIRPSPPF